MKFFLYADNLHPTQLKRRAPEHQFQMLATLPDHAIRFCRWSSQWRCGLASVVPSPGEKVWGAIFELTDEDVKLIDQFEDDVPPEAFRHVQVTVLNEAGEVSVIRAEMDARGARRLGKTSSDLRYRHQTIPRKSALSQANEIP